jgi:hypothetical protein
MKSKQLANVLLKILGLSMCLHTIPSFFSMISVAITPLWLSTAGSSAIQDRFIHQAIAGALSIAASGVIEIVIGILVIVKSRKIVEFWFKNEDE